MQSDVVCLAQAANASEAHLWRTVLEEAGIACEVVDHLDAEWFADPHSRAEVWVHRDNLMRARELLAERQAGRPPDEGDMVHPRRPPAHERAAHAHAAVPRPGTAGPFRRPAPHGR